MREWLAVRLGRWLVEDEIVRASLGKKRFAHQARWVAGQFGVGSTDLARIKPGALQDRLDEIRNQVIHEPGPEITTLNANLRTIRRYVSLSETEQEILALVCLCCDEPALENLLSTVEETLQRRYLHTYAAMLGISPIELLKATGRSSRLGSSGLVEHALMDVHPRRQPTRRFRPGIPELREQLLSPDFTPACLIAAAGRAAPAAELSLRDFPHQKRELTLLRDYLAGCLRTRRPGVNVFLYGPPGTGKTQIGRLLGRSLRCQVFESLVQDSEGAPIMPSCRLARLRGAMNFLRRERKLVVFDEAEDLFRGGSPFTNAEIAGHKGWMNDFLESNPLPILWMANCVSMLDPAFARRFDMVLEVPVPPRQVRRRIIRQAVGRGLPQSAIEMLADLEHLSPAVVRRAAKVVEQGGVLPEARAETVAGLVTNTLKAQGHKGVSLTKAGESAAYDPSLVNASTDLNALCERLREHPAGRLCLEGPPGTGKSEFGRWLARSVGLRLQTARLSDLFAPYVGETERNIAGAFTRASEDRSLLLIDEVDSLLHDRRQAVRSWEVNAVNEFLMQMERFEGLLVATTNLVEHADPAAARRFDLTIRLGFMRPKQVERMFLECCRTLKLGPPTRDQLARVRALEALTPGDFAAVQRRHRFAPLDSPGKFVGALIDLCTAKPGHRRILGFHSG